MNFLAHLFLTGKNEPLLVGNFLGDFLTNRQVAALPHPVRQGIFVHRQIDSFTDKHELVRKSTSRLRPVHGKYAPVILDVYFDFILAKNWQKFSTETLQEFAGFAYATLRQHLHLLPNFLQERILKMIADDWLVRYGSEEGLVFTFSRMKLRSSFPAYFDNAPDSLINDYDAYEEGFLAFFPDAIDFSRNLILDNIQG